MPAPHPPEFRSQARLLLAQRQGLTRMSVRSQGLSPARPYRLDDHLVHLLIVDLPRATRPGVVDRALQPPVQDPPAPLGHRLRPHAQLGGHVLIRAQPTVLGAAHHDPTPLRQRLRRLRPPRQAHQRPLLHIGQNQGCFRTTTTSHTQPSRFIRRIPGAGH